jgi:hypothetical protein
VRLAETGQRVPLVPKPTLRPAGERGHLIDVEEIVVGRRGRRGHGGEPGGGLAGAKGEYPHCPLYRPRGASAMRIWAQCARVNIQAGIGSVITPSAPGSTQCATGSPAPRVSQHTASSLPYSGGQRYSTRRTSVFEVL